MSPGRSTTASGLGEARGRLAFVFLISGVSAMGGFLFGYETVVIAVTILLVKSQFGLTDILEGWYVSCGLVWCVAGVLVASWLSDEMGRKGASVLSGVFLTLAALECAAAPAIASLITGRVLGGIGVGMASIVSPLSISEVAPPAYWGRLVSLFQVTITGGIVAAIVCNAGLQNHAVAMEQAGTARWHRPGPAGFGSSCLSGKSGAECFSFRQLQQQYSLPPH